MTMRTESLSDLISDNKEVFYKELKEVIKPKFTGLDTPEKYEGIVRNFLNQSNRIPFPRQARLIAAATEYISKKKNKSLIISSEMGTGKTEMALKIALYKKFRVNFIVCPPHLVDKWEEEIEDSYFDESKYKIIKIKRWDDLLPYAKRNLKKEKIKYFFIISRENAKLSYPKVKAFRIRKKLITVEKELDGQPVKVKSQIKVAYCPDCNEELVEGNSDFIQTSKIPYKCTCGSILRDVDKTASKNLQSRLSIAEYIKKNWKKGSIDLLIADELHEYKGGNTGQGNALAQLCSVSNKIIGLTGTLLNGYASSIFYLLYRLNPTLIKKRLGFDYNQLKYFIEQYGAFESSYEAADVNIEGVVTKKGKQLGIPKEKPKISPYLLSVLLDMTIFLRLDEIKMENGFGLPDYTEHVDLVDFDEELVKPYNDYIGEISSRIRKDKRFLGNLASDAIAVPDMPFQFHSAQNEVFYNPKYTRAEYGYTNKEKNLIKRVKKELDEGRKCLIFIHFSNKGVGSDITEMLEKELPEYKTLFLKPSIAAKKRKEWIEKNPSDILICNAELVKTGLDLLQFPTIIFYETTYNVFTLKQASRRSWRIGQRADVNVYFNAYRDTPQHKALELIGAKVNAANSLEGRLSGDDDLSSMADDDDNIQIALAKAILNGEKSSDDIQMTSITNFGNDRDWDNFELWYREEVNNLMEKEVVKETKTDVVTLFDDISNKEEKNETVETLEKKKAVAKTKQKAKKEETFIIYSGKGSKQERLEVNSKTLNDLASKSTNGGIQLSLF